MQEGPKQFSVGKESELRFEVEEGWTARVQVTRGNAEIFGIPCLLNTDYDLDVGKYAVFTWYGCDVLLTGSKVSPKANGASPLSSAYLMDGPHMLAAVNVHGRLEQEREDALAKKTRGPVVMIVGPGDSGKSTLARVLCAYAARRGKRPLYCDLDPGQNELGPPGIVGACSVELDSISVEEGLSTPASPLVYYFGYASPGDSPDAFRKNLERLAVSIEARFSVDTDAKASGCIVNTCGWVEGEGYNILLYSIQTFKPDVVLVLGQDLLLNKLKRDAGSETCNVVKLPVSGGATARNRDYRKRTRDRKVRDYFNGSKVGSLQLSPSTLEVAFDDVKILKAPSKEDISDEAMRPVGRASALDPNRARTVQLDLSLKHSLLAVSHAQAEEDVLSKNIAGFMHVQDIDMDRKVLILLSPQKGPLPGKFLLLGGVKWIDSSGL